MLVGHMDVQLPCKSSSPQAITAGPDVFEAGFAMPSIQKAVDDFGKDWEAIHHRKSI